MSRPTQRLRCLVTICRRKAFSAMSVMTRGDLSPWFDPGTFPTEIWLQIFSHLDYDDLLRVCRICRHWRPLGEDSALWRQLCLKAGLVSEADPLDHVVKNQATQWREVFQQRTLLKENWRSGKFTNFQLGGRTYGRCIRSTDLRRVLGQRRSGWNCSCMEP